MDQLSEGNLIAGFFVKVKVEGNKLTKSFINSDAGQIFELLHVRIDSGLEKKDSREQNQDFYGE
jgi:hypothetical protein